MTATAHWRWSEWKRQADVTLYIVCNLLFSLSHVLQLSSHSWAKDSQKKQQPSFNTPSQLVFISVSRCRSTPHEEEGRRVSALFTVVHNLACLHSRQPGAVYRNAAFAFETSSKRWTFINEAAALRGEETRLTKSDATRTRFAFYSYCVLWKGWER